VAAERAREVIGAGLPSVARLGILRSTVQGVI
jgi:hypothetical protein